MAKFSAKWPNIPQLPKPKYESTYHLINQEIHQRRVVHTFTMGDVEDVDVYIAMPISEWQESEKGAWVMKHGIDPVYNVMPDPVSFGYKVVITAMISERRWTEYALRFIDSTSKS